MRKIISFINHLVTCHICFGMGTKEQPNGDTVQCPACNGKGFR